MAHNVVVLESYKIKWSIKRDDIETIYPNLQKWLE